MDKKSIVIAQAMAIYAFRGAVAAIKFLVTQTHTVPGLDGRMGPMFTQQEAVDLLVVYDEQVEKL